jgi:hypothetical protein
MKGVFFWLVHWARRAGARDFYSALADLVGPVQNIFSSPYTIHFFCPHQAQAVMQGRLSLNMCLCHFFL